MAAGETYTLTAGSETQTIELTQLVYGSGGDGRRHGRPAARGYGASRRKPLVTLWAPEETAESITRKQTTSFAKKQAEENFRLLFQLIC